MTTDVAAEAARLHHAYAARELAPPPSSQHAAFDLESAYAVQRELVRLRVAAGHRPVGRKVGYANRAMWRALKLDTLVWAHMYDDTVHFAKHGLATLNIARMYSPKIEPEIVFKVKHSLGAGAEEPEAALAAVEWMALGFEIIDCPFPDWKYQPADFVAAYGLHAALIVGEPLAIDPPSIPALAESLARFTVKLMKGDELVEEGSGKNALRSPARSLGELAAAIARRSDAEPLQAGELVSTGTLTTSTPIAADQRWTASVDGLPLPPLTLQL